jgi:hypothetical protein
MVALRLDIIAHPYLGRNQAARIAPAILSGRPALQLAKRGVEAGDAVGHRRRIIGKLDQLDAADPEVGERRVAEDFCQLLGACTVAALGSERLDVDVKGLRESQQYAGGDRALVALQMGVLGRRDTQLGGHRALAEPPLAAKPPQPSTEEKLASQGHV